MCSCRVLSSRMRNRRIYICKQHSRKVIPICRLISKSNARVAEINHDRSIIFVKHIGPIRAYAFWKISCHISSLNTRGADRIEIKGNSVLDSSYSLRITAAVVCI